MKTFAKGTQPVKAKLPALILCFILTACNLGVPVPQEPVDNATAAALTVEAALTVPASSPTAATPPTAPPNSPVAIDGTTAEAADCNDTAAILSWKRDGVDYDKTEVDKPLAPGTPFTISLELQNTGNCLWTHQYKIFLDSGTPLTDENPMPTLQTGFQVKPGEAFTFNMQFTAPSAPGNYESTYRIDDQDGQRVFVFGILTTVGSGSSNNSSLSAPGDLRYTYDCSGGVTRISLIWQDRANNEQGYRIYRDGVKLSDLPSGSTVYDDIAPSPGSYRYTVAAFNAGGESATNVQAETSNCQ